MPCWVPLFKARDLTKELIKQSMLGLMVLWGQKYKLQVVLTTVGHLKAQNNLLMG
jgi:hypothetical protein